MDLKAERRAFTHKGVMMKKPKELSQLYGGKIPPDYLPAHNHITHTPTFSNGANGFRRFWIPPQWLDQKDRAWVKCPCGWRGHDPKWRVHYACDAHVEWWETEIEKRGSLEAVYQYIREELRKDAVLRGHDPDWVFQ
jgi:hypothetical protein